MPKKGKEEMALRSDVDDDYYVPCVMVAAVVVVIVDADYRHVVVVEAVLMMSATRYHFCKKSSQESLDDGNKQACSLVKSGHTGRLQMPKQSMTLVLFAKESS